MGIRHNRTRAVCKLPSRTDGRARTPGSASGAGPIPSHLASSRGEETEPDATQGAISEAQGQGKSTAATKTNSFRSQRRRAEGAVARAENTSHASADAGTRRTAGQLAASPAKRGMDPSYKLDTWRRESVSSSRELHRPPLREQLRHMFVEGGFLEMTFGGSQGQWLAFSSCRQPCEEGPHPWASLLQRAQGSRLTFGDSKE